MIAAAQAGVHEDGRETFGHSMIIDPRGKILASAGGTGEAIVIAEIDPAAEGGARQRSRISRMPASSRSRRLAMCPEAWP